jgi:hypothetical protein
MKIVLALVCTLITSLFAKIEPAELPGALQKSFTSRAADFPKADADALEGDNRIKALLDLRYLIELEGILRELLHDPATLKKQVDLEDFSSSEKTRIIEMRAEAVAHRAESLVTHDFKEPRSNPIEKLYKIFERKAKRPLSEISRNQKSLNQELERNRPDERRIDRLEAGIETNEKILAKIQTAFFGGVPVRGFEAPFKGKEEGEVASLLVKIIAARDQLLNTLRLDPKRKAAPDSEEKKEGTIGGIQVRSSKLGVLLDNSSSMQPHIPELRKEIDSGFPDSVYRECYGCALIWQAAPPNVGKRDLVLLHLEDLIIVKKTDGLYWFSDLRDPQTEVGLARLAELLERSGALFYVSSVDQKPNDELEELITGFSKK